MDKENVYHLDIKEEGKPQTFIFAGRSGCGKGTQAKLLIDYLKEKNNTPVFSLQTGETFRNLMKGGSYTGKLSFNLDKDGLLQPEFLAVWAWSHIMVDNLRGDENLVIDGCPRRLHEAPILDSALKFYGRDNATIVYLNVSREWSTEKLLARKRLDDTPENIETRLNWFESDVVPALNFLKEKGTYKFLDVNGERSIDEIHKEIISKVFNK